ncbi:hypothetical protein [Treponema sp. R6D11]
MLQNQKTTKMYLLQQKGNESFAINEGFLERTDPRQDYSVREALSLRPIRVCDSVYASQIIQNGEEDLSVIKLTMPKAVEELLAAHAKREQQRGRAITDEISVPAGSICYNLSNIVEQKVIDDCCLKAEPTGETPADVFSSIAKDSSPSPDMPYTPKNMERFLGAINELADDADIPMLKGYNIVICQPPENPTPFQIRK